MDEDEIQRRTFIAASFATLTWKSRENYISNDDYNVSKKYNIVDSKKSISLRIIQRLSMDGYINAVAWNLNGSRLAILSNFGGTVTIWRVDDWNVKNKFNRSSGAYSANSLAFLQDGTLLTAAPIGESTDTKHGIHATFSLIQWNTETGQPLNCIPDRSSPSEEPSYRIGPADTFVVSSDNTVVAGINGSSVYLFHTSDWLISRRIIVPPTPTHPDYPASVAISPDGRYLAVGTGFGHVHLYGRDDDTPLRSFVAYPGDILHYCQSIAFSPDGQLLVTGRGGMSVGEVDDGWTRLWRVSDGVNVARLTGGVGFVRTAAWSRDGQNLAVGDDRSLRLWQTSHLPPSLELRKTVRGGCFSLAFSPNGLLAASSNNEVEIYG